MYTSARGTPFPEHRALHIECPVDTEDAVKLGADRSSLEDEDERLQRCQKPLSHVPDRPDIPIQDVDEYLGKELATRTLDSLHPHLWLVARREADHIDALHTQIQKDRTIVVSEDPQLHLIWTAGKVYVKPIPKCLLDYGFWETFLASTRPGPTAHQHKTLSVATYSARQNALGFLRSYVYLVQHRSDFLLAQEHNLISTEIDYLAWIRFVMCFRDLPDTDVSKRYQYGQLRLSRLNWAARIFRPTGARSPWYYALSHWSTGPYIRQAAAPLAFLFAALSLVLSAMQVMLGADVVMSGVAGIYSRIFWSFSIAVILTSALALVLFVLIPAVVLLRQLLWGYFNSRRSAQGQGP